MRETTTNTINFAPECGKTLSEIRRPSTPKYFPLYEKKDKNIFYSDQEYANHLVEYIQRSEEKLSRKDTIRRLKSIKRYFNDKTAIKIIKIRFIPIIRRYLPFLLSQKLINKIKIVTISSPIKVNPKSWKRYAIPNIIVVKPHRNNNITLF